MKAYQKTLNLQARLERAGIKASFDQVETLRRAELTLQKWAELECGNGDNYKSWGIFRDEETGKPFMEVHPNTGKSYKYAVRDREKGAIKRIAAICKELNIYYFHQTDPRGCSLYVSSEPLPDNNYTRGVACCD